MASLSQQVLIRIAIDAGKLSPAALDMRFDDVLDQFASANGLSLVEAFDELGIPQPEYYGGMHDHRVEIIVRNAFNGLGDSFGSDEHGRSVAWISLNDHLELEPTDYDLGLPLAIDYWVLGDWLSTWRDIGETRYVLAYLDADGSRSAIGYDSHESMMHAYRELESEYLTWEEATEEEI